jgi:hypothetical protein
VTLTDAIDEATLIGMQLTIDADTERRFRTFLGEDSFTYYDQWIKADRRIREALTRAFLARDMHELSEAMVDLAGMADVLREGLGWRQQRKRFYERDIAPIVVMVPR